MIIVGSKRRIQFERKMRKRRMHTYIMLGVILLLSIYTVKSVSAEKSPQENVEYLVTMGAGQYDIKDFQEKRIDYEKSIDIKELDYNLNQDIERTNKPTVLIFHHAAATGLTAQSINEDHKVKGWGGIGYHFYIRKNGTIYRGRPEEYVGSHAVGRNYDSIGICLEGDFELEEPTEEQKSSLVKLSADMMIKYNLKDAMGHRDVYETLCPGEKFPMKEIKEKVKDEILRERNFKN